MINHWLNLGVTLLFLWLLLVILLRDWEKQNVYLRSFILILMMFSIFNLGSIWNEINISNPYMESLEKTEIVIYEKKCETEDDLTLQNEKALQKYIIEHFGDKSAVSILDNIGECYRGGTPCQRS